MSSPLPPEVSIVVRTKDRPLLLRRALQSILNQTFDAWEVVIVNDGGSAPTVDQVVSGFGDDLARRTSVIHNPTATGRWPAANAGIAATSAPLLILHDDDDTWHPEFLSVTTSYLQAHPEESAVITHIDVIHEVADGDGMRETWRYELEDHNPEVLVSDLLDFNRFVPIGFLYRRSLHDQLGLYDASLPAAADWAFNLQVVLQRPVRYARDGVFAYWHQRPGAGGADGNSVFAATDDHSFADRAHRDQRLREFVQSHGVGLPLYMAGQRKVADAQREADNAQIRSDIRVLSSELAANTKHVESLIASLQHELDHTIDARLRRLMRKLFRR